MQSGRSNIGAAWLVALRIMAMLLLAVSAAVAMPQGTPGFAGAWKQDNDRCQPRRKGDVLLRIEQKAETLKVETTIANASATARHAVQSYTTDGKVSTSIGADGDTFNTSVVWKDAQLVFSIEEHEDGRVLLSKESWSLSEDHSTLERVRERQNKERQVLVYRRIPAAGADGTPGPSGGAK